MKIHHFRPFRALQSIALVSVILLTLLNVQGQSPGAGQAPAINWPRSHTYDVQHYRINVSFDWKSKSVEGETAITLRPYANGLTEIELDAGEMTINSVKLDSGASLRFRYEGNEKLFIALDRDYRALSDITLKINYKATPRFGLTFITPNQFDPDRPFQIWSQGQARTNHYWFPCYDHPNDRATSEMIATVDEKYQVISNGTLVDVKENASARTRTWHWKMDQPFSSYLISIIVGKYAEVKGDYKGIPVSSYVYPDKLEDGKVSFGKLPQMVAHFSEVLDFDYPHSKYAQTMVRDFGGAMENITATTMTDTAMHDSRASSDVSSDGIVSHELAHTWFGNMITCKDWSELWLNESFATFFESVWLERDKGKSDYFYEMHKNQQAYYQAWWQGARRPIVTLRYSDPDALFDTYAYPRGAAVINMIRFVLGEELFWKAMRHYVKKYQWQVVETQNLVQAIEEATGQNLQWFIDQWVYKMGHPEFEITSSYDSGARKLKLSIRQTQKPEGKHPWFDSPDYFTMPVDIAVTTQSGEKIHRVWIDKKEMDITLEADSDPLIINFDRGNYIIKQVKFPAGDQALAHQLLNDTDVTGRLRAAIELGRSRTDSAVKALSEAARRDSFWGVRLEATKALSPIRNSVSREALLDVVKDTDSRIRRQAVEALALFEDAQMADLYLNLIKSDRSYFVVAEAAKALGRTRSPQAYDALIATLAEPSWQDTIRAGALTGLALLKEARSLDFAFQYSKPGHALTVRGAALLLLGKAGQGNERAIETLTSALTEPSAQVRYFAAQALGELGDERAIPVLEEAVKKENTTFVRQWISYAITQIKQAARQKAKQ